MKVERPAADKGRAAELANTMVMRARYLILLAASLGVEGGRGTAVLEHVVEAPLHRNNITVVVIRLGLG